MLGYLAISVRAAICKASAYKGRRNFEGEFVRCPVPGKQNGQGTDCVREDVAGAVGAPAGRAWPGATRHRGAAVVAARGGGGGAGGQPLRDGPGGVRTAGVRGGHGPRTGGTVAVQ